MSEFKFACPVCGQHIKCDSSQAGTVMDCPTCFQKINVPQAPSSADQKFILTGTQVGEKRPPTLAETSTQRTPAAKGVPVAAVAFAIIFVAAVGAGIYFFGGRILHLGSRWQTADVGTVNPPGTLAQAGDTLTISGSGGDIWDKADAFNFVYQRSKGDVVVTVRVADIQNTDPWAKAGVMIRESLDADSMYTDLVITPKNGVGFQQRTGTGVEATSVKLLSKPQVPYWLRLKRRDDMFTAEISPDGNKWSSAGTAMVTMKQEVYVGLAVCSHKNGTLCQAVFDSAQVARRGKNVSETPKSNANSVPATAGTSSASKMLVLPANDTNWTLVLRTNDIPDQPATGRIHGQPFLIEHASFQNGSLAIRVGTRGPIENGLIINFGGVQAEELSRKTVNVTTNVDKAAKVSLRYLDDSGTVQKPAFDSGYALRLEFGDFSNNRLVGKIYLCLPDDEKSYVMGSFVANVSKPKPKQPGQQK